MGVYKLSSPKTFKQGGTPFASMLAGNLTYSPGAFDLIQTTVLTSNVSSVTLSNLNEFASIYDHLQIRATIRTGRNNTNDGYNLRFNGATQTGASHGLIAADSQIYPFGITNDFLTPIPFGMPAANSTAGSYAGVIFDILDAFSTTKYKTIRAFGGGHTGVGFGSTLLETLDPISSMTIVNRNDAQTFITQYSRFSVYGVK